MNPLCYELLNGNLVWSGAAPGTQFPVTSIVNQLPVTLLIEYLPNPGEPMPYASGVPRAVLPNATTGFGWDDQPPGYYKVSEFGTGALITVCAIGPGQSTSYVLNKQSLCAPGDIGPIPVPTASVDPYPIQPQPVPPRPNSTIIVPSDSASVLVGCGVLPNGNVVTRAQFWKRQNDSICLAGHETRTVSYTVSSGKQQTSSDTKTVAESINASVSAGWGPVSTSISASLSQNSTTSQQVVVTEMVSSYVSHTITNPHEEPIAYLRWQLTDMITVMSVTPDTAPPYSYYGVNVTLLASLIQGENPTLAMGPYWVSGTPKPSTAERAHTAQIPKAGLFQYK